MPSSFHQAQRRGFVRGGGTVYTCRCCRRSTRPTGTGDNDGVKLCVECYDLAGEENHLSDNGEFYDSPANVLEMIAEVAAKGGDASCWNDLKAKAEEFSKPKFVGVYREPNKPQQRIPVHLHADGKHRGLLLNDVLDLSKLVKVEE